LSEVELVNRCIAVVSQLVQAERRLEAGLPARDFSQVQLDESSDAVQQSQQPSLQEELPAGHGPYRGLLCALAIAMASAACRAEEPQSIFALMIASTGCVAVACAHRARHSEPKKPGRCSRFLLGLDLA
jgi:hypothetical protein